MYKRKYVKMSAMVLTQNFLILFLCQTLPFFGQNCQRDRCRMLLLGSTAGNQQNQTDLHFSFYLFIDVELAYPFSDPHSHNG